MTDRCDGCRPWRQPSRHSLPKRPFFVQSVGLRIFGSPTSHVRTPNVSWVIPCDGLTVVVRERNTSSTAYVSTVDVYQILYAMGCNVCRSVTALLWAADIYTNAGIDCPCIASAQLIACTGTTRQQQFIPAKSSNLKPVWSGTWRNHHEIAVIATNGKRLCGYRYESLWTPKQRTSVHILNIRRG